VQAGSSLRGLYGDLVPIAVVRRAVTDGGNPLVVDCPGRDFQVEPGDIAAMLGTAEDYARYRINLEPLTDEPVEQPRGSYLSRLTAVLGGVLRDFDPGFYRAGVVILCLVSIRPCCSG
jgi:hypothetical protein